MKLPGCPTSLAAKSNPSSTVKKTRPSSCAPTNPGVCNPSAANVQRIWPGGPLSGETEAKRHQFECPGGPLLAQKETSAAQR